MVGANVGAAVGSSVGAATGASVWAAVGACVGVGAGLKTPQADSNTVTMSNMGNSFLFIRSLLTYADIHVR
jgi:hypothetical protein